MCLMLGSVCVFGRLNLMMQASVFPQQGGCSLSYLVGGPVVVGQGYQLREHSLYSFFLSSWEGDSMVWCTLYEILGKWLTYQDKDSIKDDVVFYLLLDLGFLSVLLDDILRVQGVVLSPGQKSLIINNVYSSLAKGVFSFSGQGALRGLALDLYLAWLLLVLIMSCSGFDYLDDIILSGGNRGYVFNKYLAKKFENTWRGWWSSYNLDNVFDAISWNLIVSMSGKRFGVKSLAVITGLMDLYYDNRFHMRSSTIANTLHYFLCDCVFRLWEQRLYYWVNENRGFYLRYLGSCVICLPDYPGREAFFSEFPWLSSSNSWVGLHPCLCGVDFLEGVEGGYFNASLPWFSNWFFLVGLSDFSGKGTPFFGLYSRSEGDIVSFYNGLLVSILSSYSFVNNYDVLSEGVHSMLWFSCARLLASKMKLGTVSKVFDNYGLTLNVCEGVQFSPPGG